MSDVYIIRNQNNHYLSKSKDWVDGSEANRVYKTGYKDEAINSLVEVSSKDFTLRGEILEVELNDKGLPVVEVLNPIPKEEKAEHAEISEQDSQNDGADKTDNNNSSHEGAGQTQSELGNQEATEVSDEDKPTDSLTA